MTTCGAFPDPELLPDWVGPLMRSCERELGHEPPHRCVMKRRSAFVTAEAAPVVVDLASRMRPVVFEWRDPESMEDAARVPGIRVRTERAMDEWAELYERGNQAGRDSVDRSMERAFTVGQYGSTYSVTMRPRPSGWRGRWSDFLVSRPGQWAQDAWNVAREIGNEPGRWYAKAYNWWWARKRA